MDGDDFPTIEQLQNEKSVLWVHSDADTYPEQISDQLQELETSDRIDTVIPAETPPPIRDRRKHDSGPFKQKGEKWMKQFKCYHSWAREQAREWDLIGFQRTTTHQDRVYHNIEFPDLFFTLTSPAVRLPLRTRKAHLRAIFPARVGGIEITCSDAIEILLGEEHMPTKVTDVGDSKSSGSQIHDNWRDTLIDSWDRAVEEGWTCIDEEYNLNEGEGVGSTGDIDCVMRSDDGEEYYLVEIKPDDEKHEDIDRALGQLLRYRELFLRERAYEELDYSNVHLAVGLPTVPPVYRDMATRYGIETIDITAALEST